MNDVNDQKNVDEKGGRPQSKSLGRSIKQKILAFLSIFLFIVATVSLIILYMGTISSPDAVAWAKTNRLNESSLKSFVAEYGSSEFAPDANSLISQINERKAVAIEAEKRAVEKAKADVIAAEKARVAAIETKKRVEEKARINEIAADNARVLAINVDRVVKYKEKLAALRAKMVTAKKIQLHPEIYVVMFRSDWCGMPCNRVEPKLDRALKSLNDPSIQFITIDITDQNHAKRSSSVAKENGINSQYNQWYGTLGFAAIINAYTKQTLGCINMTYEADAMANTIKELKAYSGTNEPTTNKICPSKI
jgi:thiol-disulfide isomerase/thioredoxin